MEEYIHLENLILLRKRLAEPHDESKRTVLLKLLADEEANEPVHEKVFLDSRVVQGREI